jgi:hypothetical protein
MRNSSPNASAVLQQMQRGPHVAILVVILFSAALAAFAIGAWSGQRCKLHAQQITTRGPLGDTYRPQADTRPPGGTTPEAMAGSSQLHRAETHSDTSAAGREVGQAGPGPAAVPEALSGPTQFAPAFPENRPPGGYSDQTALQTLVAEVSFLRRRVREVERDRRVWGCQGSSTGSLQNPSAR